MSAGKREPAGTRFAAPPVTGFAEIDRRFGRMLASLAREEDAAVIERTAALLSRARSLGHSCITLEEWAGRTIELAGEARSLPDSNTWREILERSEVAGDGTDVTPLVGDEHGRVYLYRYWAAERRVARAFADRAAMPASEVDAAVGTGAVDEMFARLFPAAASEETDWQAEAARTALSRGLTVISGGPGTGKTTTVARILALLATAHPDSLMAVAAPTGKAAARIGASLTAELTRVELPGPIRQRIPSEAATLHRLLGARPAGGFRHNQLRPLPHDVLVVDEASMVDLLLMDALLAAAAPTARIILLGDEDQLASVEAGFVFADLCRSARGGENPDSATTGEPSPLAATTVTLRHNYRFGEDSAIGRLAAAVRAGDADAALAVLERGNTDPGLGLVLAPLPERPIDVAAYLKATLDTVLEADDPETALERLGEARILCAGRSGPWGSENVNVAVESLLTHRRSHAAGARGTPASRWYRGRPVMITVNDYGAGLFNGDTGVCWPESAQGRARVWFPAPDGAPRPVAPARLPAHETAWAMTVHKSQGSEFESVVLLLPPDESPLCTRELIYTGLTRARRALKVIAEPSLLRSAIQRRSARSSGLFDAIAAGTPLV